MSNKPDLDPKDLDATMSACLVAIAERQDREAFRTVFEFYAPRVKSFLMRAGGNSARAEEMTQETMVAIWRKAHLYDPAKAAPATWIFTIARNQRIDAFRREKRPELDPNEPALQVSEPVSPDRQLEGTEDAAILAEAISGLSPAERQLLALAYYEDKSQSTISAELGLPLGTVKSRMRQIFAKLRGRLGGIVRDAQ